MPTGSPVRGFQCCPEWRGRDNSGDQPARLDIRDLTVKELLEEDSGCGDPVQRIRDIVRNMLGIPTLEHRIKDNQEERGVRAG